MGLGDKSRFLSGLEEPGKTLFAKLYDRALRVARFDGAAYGDFMSMDELTLLRERSRYLPDCEIAEFGGYDEAERKMPGFNAEGEAFPITALKITGKGLGGLTHRDYLGALMALGLDRHKLGDIIVSPEGAAVFVAADIADYIVNSLGEVGRNTVQIEAADPASLDLGQRRFKEIKGTVATPRLDSIVALMAGKGRSAACDLIKAGRVYLNGSTALRTDRKVADGDVITVRGLGKADVEICGLSKKDRIFVTLKKYA